MTNILTRLIELLKVSNTVVCLRHPCWHPKLLTRLIELLKVSYCQCVSDIPVGMTNILTRPLNYSRYLILSVCLRHPCWHDKHPHQLIELLKVYNTVSVSRTSLLARLSSPGSLNYSRYLILSVCLRHPCWHDKHPHQAHRTTQGI